MTSSFRPDPALAIALALVAAACAAVPAAPAGAAGGAGERLFDKYCYACHSVDRGRNKTGPSLHGVVGRVAGGEPASYMYSEAMRDSGLTWTEDRLDAYLANPAKLVPGTHMTFGGVSDPGERAALIDYLKTP